MNIDRGVSRVQFAVHGPNFASDVVAMALPARGAEAPEAQRLLVELTGWYGLFGRNRVSCVPATVRGSLCVGNFRPTRMPPSTSCSPWTP